MTDQQQQDQQQSGGGTGGEQQQSTDQQQQQAGPSGKTFTQAELDAIVQREKAKAEKAAKTAVEDAAKKAAMSETERLKTENAESERKAKEAVERANRVLLQAKVEIAAAAAGAVGDNVEAVVKLADLSGIEVGEDGDLDAKAIAAAVVTVKGKYPALFAAAAGSPQSAADFKGGTTGKRVYTEAEIKAMSAEEFKEAEKDIDAAMAEPGRPRIRS